MNPNDYTHHRRLIHIGLSMEQYNAIMNTRCPGARLIVDLGFKAKLTSSGNITFVAQGTEDAAEEIYYWADFCCP